MTVIWQTKNGSETSFELLYINECLLAEIPHRNVFDDARFESKEDGALVVFSCDNHSVSMELLQYLAGLKNYSLFHLSNEKLGHDARYYQRAKAVLRSYFDPRLASTNTYTIPLGFKSGFLCDQSSYSQHDVRPYIWSFAGQLKGHRTAMLKTFSKLGPHFVHITSAWDSDDALSVPELKEIYRQSLFALYPFGNVNPDSFRVMEALECGCVPVTLKFGAIDYFKYVFGDHPFVVCDDWRHAQKTIERLASDPRALSERQKTVWDWYESFKRDLKQDIALLLSTEKSVKLASRQFVYQQEAKQDRRLKAAFWIHFTLKMRANSILRTLGLTQ